MPSVLTATTFSADKITFGKHKPNPNGGFNIELTIGNNTDETVLQTPKMRCPFGISTDKTNPFKKSLDISFQGFETNDAIKAFRASVEAVDDLAIDYALKNSKAFFKQEYSREVIKAYGFDLELDHFEIAEFKGQPQWGPPASQRIEILQLLLAENQRQQVEGVIEWPTK